MKDETPTITLFPDTEKIHECKECKKSYAYKNIRSEFCSSTCRGRYRYKKRLGLGETIPITESAPTPAQYTPAPMPATPSSKHTPDTFLQNKNLSIDTQVAISLLKEDRDEWKLKCKELERENKELCNQVDELEGELDSKDQALHGLENQQPSATERFIASIPPQIMDQIAPHIGTLMGRLTGASKNPLAGVTGQLDEQTFDVLEKLNTWYASLPAEFQREVCGIFAVMASAKDGIELSATLNKIINALNINEKQQPTPATSYSFPSMFAATGTQ